MDGAFVKNLIELEEGTTEWDKFPVLPLSNEPGAHGVPVQPGDILVDEKTLRFEAAPLTDETKTALLVALDVHATALRQEASALLVEAPDLESGFAEVKAAFAAHDAEVAALKAKIESADTRLELPTLPAAVRKFAATLTEPAAISTSR